MTQEAEAEAKRPAEEKARQEALAKAKSENQEASKRRAGGEGQDLGKSVGSTSKPWVSSRVRAMALALERKDNDGSSHKEEDLELVRRRLKEKWKEAPDSF